MSTKARLYLAALAACSLACALALSDAQHATASACHHAALSCTVVGV